MHLSILLLFPALLLLSACTESSEPTGDASDAALGASPLQVKLDEKKAQWAADATDQTKRVYDEGIDKVDASGVIDTMKQVGDKAPAFTLPNAVGEDVSSQALLEDGPIVVVFYRGAWCPYCNITLAAWQEELETIQGLGAQLVTISPQLPDYSLEQLSKLSAVGLPLLVIVPGGRQ
ncbi:MAG: redoxin domain-containing protein, partial [Phycisphaeraceae bacterium]